MSDARTRNLVLLAVGDRVVALGADHVRVVQLSLPEGAATPASLSIAAREVPLVALTAQQIDDLISPPAPAPSADAKLALGDAAEAARVVVPPATARSLRDAADHLARIAAELHDAAAVADAVLDSASRNNDAVDRLRAEIARL